MPHGRNNTAREQACICIGTVSYQPLCPEALSSSFNPSLACLVNNHAGHRVRGSSSGDPSRLSQ